jgi:multiple sugar transport system substrate-binding protein
MTIRAALLAAALALTAIPSSAADLIVWWEKGQCPEEDQSVRELIAAFEQKTGKRVEFDNTHQRRNLSVKTLMALVAGQPPDFLFGVDIYSYFSQWAHEGKLANLADAIGPLAAQFDQDTRDHATLPDATGRRGFYALPMARSSNHVHVWKSELERAGFTLQDIPKEWEPFWAFWCEKVQPAARAATGRDDIYGVGLVMSVAASDTANQFWQFVSAYEADYLTRDGRLVIDDPVVRASLVMALDS